MNETILSNVLLILLLIACTYALHLKVRLNTTLHNLDQWREMVILFNGKWRLVENAENDKA